MEPTEASPSLKPAKHSWYTAVFVVLAVALLANIVGCLLNRPPEFNTAMDGVEYLFFVLGRMFYTAIVGALPLAAALAVLFFFDGGLSKVIVACILGLWTLQQASILNDILTRNRDNTATSIKQQSGITAAAEQPIASSAAKSKATHKVAKLRLSP